MLKRLLVKMVLPLCMIMCAFVANAQNKTITGKVVDSKDGSGVPSVTVTAKGSKNGTQTLSDGSFIITVPSATTTLVVTSVGYATQEIDISGKSDVNVSFVPTSATNLNEVVVVGYGSARRKDLTGSLASIKAKDFNQGVVTSPDQLIQGKVAGVQIINNSGAPGGAATIRIRGNSAIRTGNQPLFVIDGIPMDGRNARPGVDAVALGQTPDANPLNFINPSDIASMDVLKDASATAIYGSRGANGVVIITTKRGQSGVPKMDFNISYGTSSVLKKYDVLNASQYRAALSNYGLAASPYTGSADAQDAIFQTGTSQNYNIAVGGGNDGGRFRISLGYQDVKGIILKSGLKKYNAKLDASFKFFDKLNLDISITGTQTTEIAAPISNNAGFQGSLIGQALGWNPTRNLLKADGSFDFDAGGSTVNPLAMSAGYDDKTNETTLLGSISPSYKILPELEYKMLLSIRKSTGIRRSSVQSFVNLQGIEGRGWAQNGNAELNSLQVTHTLNYVKDVDDFSINGLLGYEYLKTQRFGSTTTGQDFLTNAVSYNDILQSASQSSLRTNSFTEPEAELQSYFARAILGYKGKYLLTATFRVDGSSKFGANNKYGYFPSIGAAWNVSEEDFLKNSTAINSLKVRASWGITGNQEFPSGASQERYGLSQGQLFQANVANPDLKWETSKTINFGIDYSVAGDRVFGSIDYFVKNTSDLLFNFDAIAPAPAVKYWKNLNGEVKNSGVEISVNAVIVKNKDLNWTLGVNASFLQNELSGYTGPSILTGGLNGQGLSGANSQRLDNGRPLNSFYLREYKGLDATGNSILTNGGSSFYYIGNPNPSTLLGISTSVSYQKFSLAANMNGAYGHDIYNNTLNSVINIGNLGTRNVASSLIGGSIKEAKANTNTPSTRYLESGNYLKLANVSLGYDLGSFGKIVKSARVSLTAQNLLVITNFTGFDPEVNTDKQVDGVPSFGIEYIPYPSARSFILGLNFSF